MTFSSDFRSEIDQLVRSELLTDHGFGANTATPSLKTYVFALVMFLVPQ